MGSKPEGHRGERQGKSPARRWSGRGVNGGGGVSDLSVQRRVRCWFARKNREIFENFWAIPGKFGVNRRRIAFLGSREP